MTVLITGGAGYIGSTVASAFLDAGDRVVVLDDLSSGRCLPDDGRIIRIGDVGDAAVLDELFAAHPDVQAVVHCAALTSAPDSLRDPLGYYRTNVANTLELLGALRRHGCDRLVFSSSAAVYGSHAASAVDERAPTVARSPYGRSKLMVERMLDDVCAAGGLSALSLRYFNPIGCDPLRRSAPAPAGGRPVLATLLDAAMHRRSFRIHGVDWDTRDGTPLRDFVDVWDLARAHVRAVHDWPLAEGRHEAVNIGSGRAVTVGELIALVSEQLHQPIDVVAADRRPGDVVGCWADIGRAERFLSWRPERSAADAVRSALSWWTTTAGHATSVAAR